MMDEGHETSGGNCLFPVSLPTYGVLEAYIFFTIISV